jgi:hypothetical protein
LLPHAARRHEESSAEARDDAFLACGARTVDECDVLVAVWDGKDAGGRGGTGDIVAYARSQEKPIVWIHAVSGEVVEERLELIAARDAIVPREAVAEPLVATAAARHATLEKTFAHFNDTANRLRPRAVNLNLALVSLHLVSAGLGFATLVFTDKAVLQSVAGVLSLVLLATAFVLPVFFKRAHLVWMNHRVRAEICRSALAVWPLPNAEDILAALRLPVDERLQRSILLLRALAALETKAMEPALRAYARERIEGQLEYYREHASSARRQHRWLRITASVCTFSAIAGSLSGRAGLYDSSMDIFRGTKLVILVLPLISAALLSSMAALDLGRRSARYHEMAAFLQRAQVQSRHALTWTALKRVVIDVEKTLLLEIWEWYSLARFSPGG